MIQQLSEAQILAVSDSLASQGYAIVHDFLSKETIDELRSELLQVDRDGLMHQASIGRAATQTHNARIRQDRICWIEPNMLAGAKYLQVMNELQAQLNRYLFLSLVEYEGHYACYEPGGYYRKHVDRHRDLPARTISSVFYLNDDWQAADGGELLIYSADNIHGAPAVTLLPLAGTLVLFRSDDIPHEVLPSRQCRYSIAGWFRVRVDSVLASA